MLGNTYINYLSSLGPLITIICHASNGNYNYLSCWWKLQLSAMEDILNVLSELAIFSKIVFLKSHFIYVMLPLKWNWNVHWMFNILKVILAKYLVTMFMFSQSICKCLIQYYNVYTRHLVWFCNECAKVWYNFTRYMRQFWYDFTTYMQRFGMISHGIYTVSQVVCKTSEGFHNVYARFWYDFINCMQGFGMILQDIWTFWYDFTRYMQGFGMISQDICTD